MDILTLSAGVIASLVAEYLPSVNRWFLRLSTVQRFLFFAVYAAAWGMGLYLHDIVRGAPFSWPGLGMAAWSALLAWLGSQGAFGTIRARNKRKIMREWADAIGFKG